MPKIIIGVMGGGDGASERAVRDAYRLGELIAEQGWALLSGGRNVGVMDASAAGARSKGGLTIGILPGKDTSRASAHLDICILTGLGDARNVVNVLSSDVLIACAGRGGTISEIALALKNGRPVIVLNFDVGDLFASYGERLRRASTPEEAVEMARQALE
jgi:uncharacterized protein (TIGR00725 family)